MNLVILVDLVILMNLVIMVNLVILAIFGGSHDSGEPCECDGSGISANFGEFGKIDDSGESADSNELVLVILVNHVIR